MSRWTRSRERIAEWVLARLESMKEGWNNALYMGALLLMMALLICTAMFVGRFLVFVLSGFTK